MTRTKSIMIACAAVLAAAGTMASSVTAQKVGPDGGWTPGQPVLVSITSPDGVPLMVVHAGRIPLASDARVRLMLPNLEGTGLVYTVSTVGAGDDERRADVEGADKKPQYVVGRVHKEFIQSPASPVLGTGGSGLLSTGPKLDEYSLLAVETNSPPHTGTIAATATDDNGTRIRDIVVPTVGTQVPSPEGVVQFGGKTNLLGITRSRVHGLSTTVVGPLEASAGGGAAALTLGDPRINKKKDEDPKPPRTKKGPRPLLTIPVPGQQPILLGGGTPGAGGIVILLLDDQGVGFESSAG